MRLTSAFMLVFAIGAVIVSATLPALAQTVLDVGPAAASVLDFLTPIIALGAAGGAGWLIFKAAGLMGLKADAFHRAAVEAVLDRAIGFAIVKVGDRARAGIPVRVRSQAVAVAVDYALRSIPGALKYFNKSRDDVVDMIEARLEDVLVDDDSQVARDVPAPKR